MDRPSIWERETPPEYPPLQERLRTDVAIIGAGMCGLLTAWRLCQAGVQSIVVLEAGDIAGGTTAHTTGKVTVQHGLLYHRLLQGLGIERAALYAHALQEALDAYAALCRTELPQSDWRRCAALSYVTEPEERRRIEDEAEAALRLGLTAEATEKSELPFSIAAAVKFPRQGYLHPLRFAYGLAALLTQRGVRIFAHSRVRPRLGDGHRAPAGALVTAQGSVLADTVIVATRYPLSDKPTAYVERLWQERSYLLALRGVPPLRDMYLGVGDNAYSFRPWEEGMLLGGEGHLTGHGQAQARFRRLEQISENWYPEREVAAGWSAQDCMTRDGLPYIGRYHPWESHGSAEAGRRVLLATGFNKWGMAGSMLAATLLTDAVREQENPVAALVAPGRMHTGVKSRSFLLQTANMVGSYLNGYRQKLSDTVSKLTPGDARVMWVHGERVGVYRDESGTLFAIKPICPHMGCVLKWNAEERSWDCPCHGSRFDYTGRLLSGPATAPLQATKDTAIGAEEAHL